MSDAISPGADAPISRQSPSRLRRLRRLFVILLLSAVAVLFVGLVNRLHLARRQKEALVAMTAIQEARYEQARKEMKADNPMNLNYILFDWQVDLLNKKVLDDKAFYQPPEPTWLTELLGVEFFHDIVWVSIDWAREGDLVPCRDLRHLKKLFVRGAISNADLGDLDELSQLEELTFVGAKISDEGVQRIGRLKKLRVLSLQGTAGVSEDAVAKLQAELPKCRIIR